MKVFAPLLLLGSFALLFSCTSQKSGELSKVSKTNGTSALTSNSDENEKKSNNAELKWYNWNEGYALSQKSKKIVLVDLYTSWCGWCKRMDHDTYTNPEIIKYINANFIPIKLNPEAEGTYTVDNLSVSGAQLMGMLTNNQNTGYPTIIFIYPTRNIELYPGYQDAAGFKTTLASIVEKSNTKK